MIKEMKRKSVISKLEKNKNKPNYIYKLEQQRKVK